MPPSALGYGNGTRFEGELWKRGYENDAKPIPFITMEIVPLCHDFFLDPRDRTHLHGGGAHLRRLVPEREVF